MKSALLTTNDAKRMPILAPANTSHQWWRLSVIREIEQSNANSKNSAWTVGMSNLLRIFGVRTCKYLNGTPKFNKKLVSKFSLEIQEKRSHFPITILRTLPRRMISMNGPMGMISMHLVQTRHCQYHWYTSNQLYIAWKWPNHTNQLE